MVDFLSNSLTELISQINNDKKEKISFLASQSSLSLEINLPLFISAQELSDIFYLIYNELFYLFNYLNYQVKFSHWSDELNQSNVKEYLDFLYFNPFLWKNKNLFPLWKQWQLTEKINFRDKVLYLPLVNNKSITSLRSDILVLKKILNDFGLTKLALTSEQIKKSRVSSSTKTKKIDGTGAKETSIFVKINLQKEQNKKAKKLLTKETENNWKERKIIELGIHTKFSSLDGISSPDEYIKTAQEKKYSALGITEHFSVQSFPDFWHCRNSEIKLVYGCEMEMLEDEFPPYIFNDSKSQAFLEQNIEDLTYCIFDLETTGFFSQYNEIIELGYVIWRKGEIIKEQVHLICPEREIAPELFTSWYTDIDPKKLKKEKKIKQLLPLIRQDWKNCVLVAHNARNFDFTFLNKVWSENFGEELPNPVIDTLPLSWILFPEKKSFSLEKLSRSSSKDKTKQTHRALDDSKLLTDLFVKLLKILKEKDIQKWKKAKSLVNHKYFPNRGYKVKVLAKNQKGLNSLYQLVTLSHTDNLFRKPCIFRSDLIKHRQNLLIGASGSKDGENFSIFSAFNSSQKRKKSMEFYDYLEISSPSSFRHLWLNGRLREEEVKEILFDTIWMARTLNIPTIASHNVHYCQPEQKIIKQIVVANEGMNGSKHPLFNEATLDGKKDYFANLPEQHLRTQEEIIEDWKFLDDADLMEELIFINPQGLIDKIEEVIIFDGKMQYPNFSENEQKLVQIYQEKAQKLFGSHLPTPIKERMEKEWKIIKENYLSIYWLSYQIVKKTHQDGFIVGSRGSVGSSFIAYLLNITDLNPLPPYYFCHQCQYFDFFQSKQKVFSCYDILEYLPCPKCKKSDLKLEGHSLPFETFFGWKGEKIPDIDLNFSGEYQKVVHDYIRTLLGEKNVYRIGTINKLSQQTAEIFLREYKKIKKELNPKFNSYNNNGDDEKIIEQLKGIKRTTGQHPGGLLIIPEKLDIHDYTPLNYPADNRQAEWKTTHFEYNFLAKIFLKLDILGHDEPTILQKLRGLTEKDPFDISFNDKQIMDIFTFGDALGIPEFGTEFVQKNFLKPLKPTKFSQLVQISGFSHGTNVWTQNQQHFYKEGMKLEELIACREDIWAFLTSWGVDNKVAFISSEYIRKGKWANLSKSIKESICEKLGLTNEFVTNLMKNFDIKQDKLFDNISQEISKLEPDKIIDTIKELNKCLNDLSKEIYF